MGDYTTPKDKVMYTIDRPKHQDITMCPIEGCRGKLSIEGEYGAKSMSRQARCVTCKAIITQHLQVYQYEIYPADCDHLGHKDCMFCVACESGCREDLDDDDLCPDCAPKEPPEPLGYCDGCESDVPKDKLVEVYNDEYLCTDCASKAPKAMAYTLRSYGWECPNCFGRNDVVCNDARDWTTSKETCAYCRKNFIVSSPWDTV